MRKKCRIAQNKTTKTIFSPLFCFCTEAAFMLINETDFLMERQSQIKNRSERHSQIKRDETNELCMEIEWMQ